MISQEEIEAALMREQTRYSDEPPMNKDVWALHLVAAALRQAQASAKAWEADALFRAQNLEAAEAKSAELAGRVKSLEVELAGNVYTQGMVEKAEGERDKLKNRFCLICLDRCLHTKSEIAEAYGELK